MSFNRTNVVAVYSGFFDEGEMNLLLSALESHDAAYWWQLPEPYKTEMLNLILFASQRGVALRQAGSAGVEPEPVAAITQE